MKAKHFIVGLVVAGGTYVLSSYSPLVSLDSPIVRFRMIALDRLTDETVLAQVAATDADRRVRLTAFERLTEQEAIAHAAIQGIDSNIRNVAVFKLTDQDALARVAIAHNSLAAVEKLTDHGALAEVADDGSVDWKVRLAALGKLTDGAVLVRLATIGETSIRSAAVARLTSAGVASAARDAADSHQRALLLAVAHLLRASDRIPAEHRRRVLSTLMPLALRYGDPMWISLFGSLQAMTLDWQGITVGGYRHAGRPARPVDGERITFSATFTPGARALTASWSSSIGYIQRLETRWISAEIDVGDAYVPWCNDGGGATLARIATADGYSRCRAAAVDKLNDELLLARIAKEDDHDGVRLAATLRLRAIAQ